MRVQSSCYCTNLRRAAGTLTDRYDEVLRPAGLRAAQYSLLAQLSRLGSANITHWARYAGLDRSTMVRNIRLLRDRGLVEPDAGSGKTFRLSPEGQAAVDRAAPLWAKAQEELCAWLGQADADALIRISRRLQTLDTPEEGGGGHAL